MFRNRLVPFFFWVAVCFLGRPEIHAQKFYLFTGGDVRDKVLGSAIEESFSSIRDCIEWSLPPKYLARYNDPNSGWNGPEVNHSQNTRRDILTAINRCPAGPNDTIFFYWCGHGAYNVQNGEKKHYLLMPRGGGKVGMYRSEILGALKRKHPRLVVLITDSCNSFQKLEEPVCEPCEPACEPLGEPEEPKITPLFLSLFFQCRGTVDVNSSDWNQKAAILEGGQSIFSLKLLDNLNALDPATWEVFLQRVNEDMNYHIEALEELGEDQEIEKTIQSIRIWSLPKPDDSVTIPEQDIASTISDAGE